jgi:hypothetical protein
METEYNRYKAKDRRLGGRGRANCTIKDPATEQEHGPSAASPPSNLSAMMHAYYGEEDNHRLKYLQMCRPVSTSRLPL